ncbi:MAG: DUF4136 domain-containing protein [Bacteroidota bacterium]|nr:DUF4136 domain-containing protein [Bacteroidota bacterium]
MKLRTLAIILSIAVLSACESINVTADWDKTVDFTQFKTYSYYGWARESDKILSQFNKIRIEEAFGKEFEKRGLQYVESGGELVVSLFIVVDQKTGVTAYTDYYGAGAYGYYRPWGWGAGYSTTSYHEYDYLVGTLVCDVFDDSSKKLIWQGVGSRTVDDNPGNRDRNISRSVAMIMSYYPVQAGK